MKTVLYSLLLLFLISAIGLSEQDAAKSFSAGEQIKWQVLSSGSNRGISINYAVDGTAGQTAIGKGTSTNFGIAQGYWQTFGGTGCCVKAGDVNNNGSVNLLDVTFLINFLYKSGAQPPCRQQADVNGNGVVNLLDITYLINFLYKSGPAPKCPAA